MPISLFHLTHSEAFSGSLCLCNCTYRTLSLACTAIDASVCTDLVMSVTLLNCLYRTLRSAGTAADARITNHTCHGIYLL